jgi:hypothetical protein
MTRREWRLAIEVRVLSVARVLAIGYRAMKRRLLGRGRR